MKNYMIATAKRVADQYGVWYKNNDPLRQKKLDALLKTVNPQKVRDKARSIINYRYGE
jgi:hypothetical protein